MKRQIPLAALAAASAQDIDHYLMSGKSILCSLGANKLRSRYTHLGLICKFALWAIMLFKPDRNGKLRRRAANVLRFFFPINKFETHYMNLDGRRHHVTATSRFS